MERTSMEIERIRDQLRRAVLGDAWHGPSVAEAVAAFDADTSLMPVR